MGIIILLLRPNRNRNGSIGINSTLWIQKSGFSHVQIADGDDAVGDIVNLCIYTTV